MTHSTSTGKTYGKLYGNQGSRLVLYLKGYKFPIVPGVYFSRQPAIILTVPGVLFGKLYFEGYNLPELPGTPRVVP
jgi:hypothetical protein